MVCSTLRMSAKLAFGGWNLTSKRNGYFAGSPKMWNWQSQLLGGGGGTGARVSRTHSGARRLPSLPFVSDVLTRAKATRANSRASTSVCYQHPLEQGGP